MVQVLISCWCYGTLNSIYIRSSTSVVQETTHNISTASWLLLSSLNLKGLCFTYWAAVKEKQWAKEQQNRQGVTTLQIVIDFVNFAHSKLCEDQNKGAIQSCTCMQLWWRQQVSIQTHIGTSVYFFFISSENPVSKNKACWYLGFLGPTHIDTGGPMGPPYFDT